MAAKLQFQARSSLDGNLYSWRATGLDFAGAGYLAAGYPGTPQDITLYTQGAPALAVPVPVTLAITAPLAGGVVLQGAALAISGTLSRASVVTVYANGVSLGTALVSGLTWTLSWSPGSSGAVSLTAQALAADTGSGSASAVAFTVQAVISPSRFSAGGFWDFRALGGIVGDTQTAAIPSAVGSNVLTVSAGPTLSDTAIGGNRSLLSDATLQQLLRCDALAARVTHGNAWTAIIRMRQTLSTYNPLFCAGYSGGNTYYFQAIQLPGTQSLQLLTNSPGSGIVQRVGMTDMQFDEHTIIVTSDGSSVEAYIDGASESLSLGTMDPNALLCDRFAFAAVVSSVPSQWFTGPVQFCGFTFDHFSAADVAVLQAQLLAGDLLTPKASRKQIAPCGDSITATSINTALGSGNREYLLQWISDHRLSIHCVGQYSYGSQPERNCVAQGGNNMQTIAAHFTTACSDPTFRPDVVRVQMGTNDMSDNTLPATQAAHLATFRTYINQMRSDAHAAGLNPKFVIATIPPFSTAVLSGVSETNAAAFDAGLQAPGTGELDVFAAAFPGELVARPDFYAALGSAWNLPFWDSYPTPGGIPFGTTGSTADSTHPNENGVQAMGAAEILAAGLVYRALSPTLVPLQVWIKSPAAGASVPVGAAFTIALRASRYPSTVNIKANGVLLGAATMVKQNGTYSATLPAGGTYALTAEITDTLDGSVATSVSCTVLAAIATIDKSLFAAGLYVVSVPGNQGDSVGTLASSSGAAFSLTPSTPAPVVYLNAAYGNTGVFFVNDGNIAYTYFRCDAIAPSLRSATGNWMIACEFRVDKSGEQPVWSAQCSSNANERLYLRVVGGAWVLRRTTPSANQDFTGPAAKYPTDDVRVTVKCAAGVISIIDRAFDEIVDRVTVLGPITGPDYSSALDRFAFAASYSSVAFEGCTSYGTKWAFCPSAPSDANVSILHSEWQANSLLVSGPNRVWMFRPGDSIEQETQDQYTSAGMRNLEAEFYGTNGLSVAIRGGTEAGGPGYQGVTRYGAGSFLSGQDIVEITTQALIDIAHAPGLTGYWPCYMGGGQNNVLVPPATICSLFVTQFQLVFNAMTAPLAHRFARITPLIPHADPAIQANLVALAGIWQAQVVAPLQALFPGAIYNANRYLALGGVWSAANWGTDTGHMLRAGCVLASLHPLYGDLAGVNELGETIAQRLLRECKTVNRVPLSGAITSPAPSASFAHGSAQTVLCDLSRIGGKPTLVVDGADVGVLYPIDIYDFTVFSGSAVKKPHVQWGYAWTVPAAGTHALTVRYLDADGVTTYTTPAVSVVAT
jgi:lysophospholipase L1-like esterase